MALKTTAAQLVAAASARIKSITPRDVMGGTLGGQVVIVDVRDVRERKRQGFIPLSVHAPRDMIEFWVDPESPYFKPVFGQPGAAYVFHCASDWRAVLTVATLQDMRFEALHLRGGFEAWVAAGGPVDRLG